MRASCAPRRARRGWQLKPPELRSPNAIEIEGLVSVRDLHPYVALIWGAQRGQLSPPEALEHAIAIIEGAQESIADAFLLRFLRERLQITPADSLEVLADFRLFRHRLAEQRPAAAPWPADVPVPPAVNWPAAVVVVHLRQEDGSCATYRRQLALEPEHGFAVDQLLNCSADGVPVPSETRPVAEACPETHEWGEGTDG